MDIRPIRTDDDHAAAVAEIETLWGAAPDTTEGDRLDVLATLVSDYEDRRWPVPDADPVDAIRQSMEMEGRSQADLAVLLGSASRASEILRRKRSLTIPMIRVLAGEWRIPAETLVQPYKIAS